MDPCGRVGSVFAWLNAKAERPSFQLHFGESFTPSRTKDACGLRLRGSPMASTNSFCLPSMGLGHLAKYAVTSTIIRRTIALTTFIGERTRRTRPIRFAMERRCAFAADQNCAPWIFSKFENILRPVPTRETWLSATVYLVNPSTKSCTATGGQQRPAGLSAASMVPMPLSACKDQLACAVGLATLPNSPRPARAASFILRALAGSGASAVSGMTISSDSIPAFDFAAPWDT
jgi:hypothetical protein